MAQPGTTGKSEIFLALEAFTLQDGSRTGLRHPRIRRKIPRGDGSARYHRKIRDFPGLGSFHPPRRFPYRSSPPPYTNKKTLRGDGSARYGAGLLIRCSLNSGVRIPLPALIFVCLRSKHTKVRGGFGPLGSWTFVSFIARRRSKMSKMSHFAEVRIPLPAPILLVRLK